MCVAGGWRLGLALLVLPFETWSATAESERVQERRDVRLVGGASHCEGELEVMHQNQWRPISYRSWRGKEGGVVCRQLGCGALVYTGRAPPPAGPRDAWRFLWCGTNRTTDTQAAVNHTAHFLFPAAVPAQQGNYTCVYLVTFCSRPFTSSSYVLSITIWKYYEEVMLVWGSSPCNGRLLVNFRDRWEMLASESAAWGLQHAAIVCRQRRCGMAISTRRVTGRHRMRGLRYFSDCQGSEGALLDCGTGIAWPSHSSVEVNCEARQRERSEDDLEEDYSTEDQ